MRSSGSRRLVRRLGVTALGCVLALGLAEIACRIDALFPAQHYSARGARAYFSFRAEVSAERDLEAFAQADPRASQLASRPIPQPWVGWSDEGTLAAVDEASRWYESKAAAETFDVLVLGGSVAAELANVEGERLGQALSASPKLSGRAVRVWNHGHAAYKAPQSSAFLLWLLALGHRPDAVVLVDGFNEVAIAESNALSDSHPQYPFFEYWSTVAGGLRTDVEALDRLVAMRQAQMRERGAAATFLRLGFDRSALLTRIGQVRLAALRRDFEAARDRYRAYVASKTKDRTLHGPEFDPAPQAITALAVRAWFENSRAVQALCAAHGIACLHVLQPNLHDAGSKPLTEQEVRQGGAQSGWIEGVQRGYPKLREAGLKLRELGLSCADATALFKTVGERLYVDVCHLNDEGNRRLSEFVADALLARIP